MNLPNMPVCSIMLLNVELHRCACAAAVAASLLFDFRYFYFLLSQLAVAVAVATCWTATVAAMLASLHCDALPHPVLACLLLLRHRRSCLIVVLKSDLIHCPTALLPMPLQHLLVLLRRLYCCCPQLIVASFPLSPVYYRGRCHHTLWRQMLLHRPTMLFPFR